MLRDDLVKELQEAHLKWSQDPGARPPLYSVFADVMFEFMAKRLGRRKPDEEQEPQMKVRMSERQKW